MVSSPAWEDELLIVWNIFMASFESWLTGALCYSPSLKCFPSIFPDGSRSMPGDFRLSRLTRTALWVQICCRTYFMWLPQHETNSNADVNSMFKIRHTYILYAFSLSCNIFIYISPKGFYSIVVSSPWVCIVL